MCVITHSVNGYSACIIHSKWLFAMNYVTLCSDVLPFISNAYCFIVIFMSYGFARSQSVICDLKLIHNFLLITHWKASFSALMTNP